MNIKAIESLYESDQEAIKNFKDKKISHDELRAINDANTTYIAKSISDYGFPFKNNSSGKAYTAAFLIIQHSGNLELIKKTVDIFTKADATQVNKRDLGYLIDRSRVLKKQPQLYGTQYRKLEDGSIKFLEIEDEANLEKRRAELDMETFEKYKSKVEGH